MNPPVILASTSRYRAELLQRLQIQFTQIAPECDETPLENETALALVERLAIAKATSIAEHHPNALVIGSDQVACCNDIIIGKPENHTAAIQQLNTLSGQNVDFHTGLCVMQQQTQQKLHCVITTNVVFKTLTSEQIERYLLTDKPYDCAASFRSEGYGSTIVDRITTNDPTALIGLPVILVADYLNQLGLLLP